MLTVYKAIPNAGKPWTFGLGVRCETWREVNDVRRRIAMDALRDRDAATPLTYDANGNLAAEGWEKGLG